LSDNQFYQLTQSAARKIYADIKSVDKIAHRIKMFARVQMEIGTENIPIGPGTCKNIRHG